jgi:M6 family metalloprotease-like protein
MKRTRPFLITIGFLGAVVLAGQPSSSAQSALAPPPPVDRQIVRDQDDMTWDDYKPIPGTSWNDPRKVASVRTIRLAILCADFPDVPFVMTLPKQSDKYGNPQVDPIKREQVAQYTQDFYTKPLPVNHGHTIHEYWMEQSRGKVGVAVTTYGPYRMPNKSYQYGFAGGGGAGGGANNNMPFDEKPSEASMQADLDKMWQAEQGADIRNQFDLVMRMYAGYDESSVWQEFGEMKFQTKEDITPEFGNPDPSKPRWARTRYVEWTSWDAAKWLWSNSAIITGEASGAIRHEVSHAAFRIGDNYNNPYVQPYRRVGSGPWDLMDRGSFNGPGGPHKRYLVPKTEGDVMSAGIMLRQKIAFDFLTDAQVLTVKRDNLGKTGLVVANVTARAIDPVAPSLSGIVIRLDDGELAVTGAAGARGGGAGAGAGRGAGAGAGAGAADAGGRGAGGQGAGRGAGAVPPTAGGDHTPVEDPVKNPLWSGNPTYNFYSMEVVQRMGYDSYEPDSGVLIAKNKDQAGPVGGPNSFNVFNWVIDAHPEDINKIDFKRPNGEPVMRTIADYRQLNDALFHAGTNSGSQSEWIDEPNRLHFYVIDRQLDARGVLSYTLGVASLDGAGPHTRGLKVDAPRIDPAAVPGSTDWRSAAFILTNTGSAAPIAAGLHKTDVTPYVAYDIYRLKASIEGNGWSAVLPNEFAAVGFGKSQSVPVYVAHAATADKTAKVTLTATSESDPKKTMTVTYSVR